MKIILANGCFDPLHAGHVRHLQSARAMGDTLIVALTLDEFVNKGPHRPTRAWLDRALDLAALKCVDLVIPVQNGLYAVRWVKPDIFVKGIDYLDGHLNATIIAACEEMGVEIRYTTSQKLSIMELLADKKRLA